jgi:ferritin-like metal-binding protein YciE
MADTREILIDWLKDAHSMELAGIDNLEHQIRHLDDYPELRAKYQEQVILSRRQEQRIDRQLRALGTDASSLRDAVVRMAGRLQAMAAGLTPDEVVKQATATLACEEWEIANFRALAAAAQREGEAGMSAMFSEMADERMGMTAWLTAALPSITRRYLDLRARA